MENNDFKYNAFYIYYENINIYLLMIKLANFCNLKILCVGNIYES